MKKIIAIAAAIALVATFGAGMAFAGSNTSNGVPAQKASYGTSDVMVTTDNGTWQTDPDMNAVTIHTPNNSANSLIISFTGESTLITDNKLSGSTGSTATAALYVRVEVDGSTAPVLLESDTGTSADGVALNYRFIKLTGNLWESTTSANFTGLPEQYIDIYEETRSANGFNFIVPDIGGGTHTITVQYYVDTGETGTATAGVIIGKRTLVIEDDNMN